MSSSVYWNIVHRSQMPQGCAKGFLSSSERLKLSGMRFPKRRDEWALGRWAAKCLVHSIPAYRQYALEKIEIQNTAEGVPFIHLVGGKPSQESLSISHSDPFAVCAISLDHTFCIGADLERIEPRSEAFVKDYFTVTEMDLVLACPERERPTLVNLIWSTKEAMLKALSTGLRRDTRSVEVLPEAGNFSDTGEWHKINVQEVENLQRNWAVWGQKRGNFVLTLAGFSTLGTDLPDPILVNI